MVRNQGEPALLIWMFDVLECEGENLRKRPAKERNQRLIPERLT
jgi:ATP-dependent DNA ligase